jgi:hypothetical protein
MRFLMMGVAARTSLKMTVLVPLCKAVAGGVQDGADYDCYRGEGGGPYYTEPGVTYDVTGYDRYGLDREGDGSGCE